MYIVHVVSGKLAGLHLDRRRWALNARKSRQIIDKRRGIQVVVEEKKEKEECRKEMVEKGMVASILTLQKIGLAHRAPASIGQVH